MILQVGQIIQRIFQNQRCVICASCIHGSALVRSSDGCDGSLKGMKLKKGWMWLQQFHLNLQFKFDDFPRSIVDSINLNIVTVTLTKMLVTLERIGLQVNAAHIWNPWNKCNSMILVKLLQLLWFYQNLHSKFDDFSAIKLNH